MATTTLLVYDAAQMDAKVAAAEAAKSGAEAAKSGAEAAKSGAEAAAADCASAVDEVSADAGRVLGGARHYPLTAAATTSNATQLQEITAAIRGVRVVGVATDDTVYIERVRRNSGGFWQIYIARSSDGSRIAQLSTSTNPEPSDPGAVSRIELTGLIAGVYVVVDIVWAEITLGANYFTLGTGLTLAPSVLAPFSSAVPLSRVEVAPSLSHVIFPDTDGQFFSYDPSTRTFAWPQFVIVDRLVNASYRYRVAAGTVVLASSYDVVWVDLDAARRGNATGTSASNVNAAPASVVRVGQYHIAGTNRYVGAPHQFPIFAARGSQSYAPTAHYPYVDMGTGSSSVSATYDTDEVVVQVTGAGAVNVWMAGGGESGAWVRYALARFVSAGANADVWTIQGVWHATRTGDEAFADVRRLVIEDTEILCAVQEVGAADFMGGRAHGDEVASATPRLIVDGQDVSLSSAAYYRARDVLFVQASQLYQVGSSGGTVRATRGLHLRFAGREMSAAQVIDPVGAWALGVIYFGMIAPHRYQTFVGGSSEDNTSTQISAYAAFDTFAGVIDCDARNDTVVYASEARSVVLWGDDGYRFEVEVDELRGNLTTTPLCFVQTSQYSYNKAYIGNNAGFTFVGSVNERLAWRTRWRFFA